MAKKRRYSPRRWFRRRRSGSGKSLQKSVFKYVRIGALVAPAAAEAYSLVKVNSAERIPNHLISMYTGVDTDDGSFDVFRLAKGWLPFITATVVTYGVQKLGGIIRKF